MKDLRIVFLGTPDFAVGSLKILVENNLNVVAVVTAPDKPAGRGMQLQQSAVKQYALQQNIPVLQPEKLKNETFLQELQRFKADLQIVVAFRMLPELVWNMPTLGTINVHASLLPNYRGAAPINWALINGEKETGVTIFKLKHEIDTGNILLQQSIAIDDEDNAASLYVKLKELGATTLIKAVLAIAKNTVIELPQPTNDVIKTAPKIYTETGLINFNRGVEEIHNLVRGLSPNPCAFTYLNDKLFKLIETKFELTQAAENEPLGTYKTDGKTYLKFVCKDGYLACKIVQLEGKKKMAIEDFLRGNKL